MGISQKAGFMWRFALALFVVATTMAVSCPQPTPPEPEPPIPVDTKSAERKQLESAYVEGYQTLYLHVRYTEDIPQAVDDEVECEIHYRLAAGESTTLIVKLVVVKASDEYLWLWNEFQKVGMIVQRLS